MKIAVFFLILGLSSFFETSNGQGCQLKKLGKAQTEYHVRCMQDIAEKIEILKTCPESERKLREQCIMEALFKQLNLLSFDVGCSLKQITPLLGLPLQALTLLENGNLIKLLEVAELNKLLSAIVLLLEGILAQAGLLLKDLLTTLSQSLGVTLTLLNNLPLHKNLEEVTKLVSGLLEPVLQNVGGLTNVLAGLNNFG